MRKKSGFTLVELAVVVVIVVVLAAIAVPRFKASGERAKASEAFNFLSAVRSSQERYDSRHGVYSMDMSHLDIDLVAPKYFTVGSITADQEGWSLTLTRSGASAGYGAYTIAFTKVGYDSESSTIAMHDGIDPMEID